MCVTLGVLLPQAVAVMEMEAVGDIVLQALALGLRVTVGVRVAKEEGEVERDCEEEPVCEVEWVVVGEREGDWEVAGVLVPSTRVAEEEMVVVGEREGDWEVLGVLVPSTCTAPANPSGSAGPDTLLQSAPFLQAPEQAEVVKPVVLP